AVHTLLSHRLPTDEPPYASHTAKSEWLALIEGQHPLWEGISDPYRETIRAFLAHFHHEIIRTATKRPTPFDFRGGSIGNFFLTGSRLFFSSLEAAVFQFARITRSPPMTEVVPVVTTGTGGVVSIAAALRDGAVVFGQCEISHPGTVAGAGSRSRASSFKTPKPTSPKRTQSNLIFSKTETMVPLASAIRRVFYVNPEKQETFPELSPLVAPRLSPDRHVIYGCGSLYTSILPCLVVPGVGRLLADAPSRYPRRHKILLLNGSHDRETSGYTALDFVLALTDALNYSGGGVWHVDVTDGAAITAAGAEELESEGGKSYMVRPHRPCEYITHMLYPEGGELVVDLARIAALGIACVLVPARGGERG
ncbi:hypothetical protein BDK51DRAFT_14828, partial [Blyttiomyces helicus]